MRAIALAEDDFYLWLEDVEGEKAPDFAGRQNELSIARSIKVPECGPMHRIAPD